MSCHRPESSTLVVWRKEKSGKRRCSVTRASGLGALMTRTLAIAAKDKRTRKAINRSQEARRSFIFLGYLSDALLFPAQCLCCRLQLRPSATILLSLTGRAVPPPTAVAYGSGILSCRYPSMGDESHACWLADLAVVFVILTFLI